MNNFYKIALLSNFKISHCTAQYVLKALENLGHYVVPINPFDYEASNNHEKYFDFLIAIDCGQSFEIPSDLIYKQSAMWAIDTHLNFFRYLKMSLQYQFIFCAQLKAVRLFKKIDIQNVYWLPLGADEEFHSRKSGAAKYDVAFVGNLSWGHRKNVLKKLKKDFQPSYIGQASHEKIGEIYGEAKIVFNISINDDLNMRVFEALCSGADLITDDVEGMKELFPEQPFFLFDKSIGYPDLRRRIEGILLGKEVIPPEIKNNFLKNFSSNHSYESRVKAMLKVLQSASSNQKHLKISRLYTNRVIRPFFLFVNFSDQLYSELINKIQRVYSSRLDRYFG